jgi:hypothetical protein
MERVANNQIDRRGERLRRELILFLKVHTDPCTKKQLLKAVHGRKKSKLTAFRQLLQEGAINKVGTGKRGDPFRYSLVNSSYPTDDEIIL